MKDKLRFYKIRDSKTGLYSSGGMRPQFNKKGKVWTNIGHVKAHLISLKKVQDEQEKQGRAFVKFRPSAFVLTDPRLCKAAAPAADAARISNDWEIDEFVFEKIGTNVVPIAEIMLLSGLF